MKKVSNTRNDKKIAFYTLGCKLNFAETSMISRKFEDKGYIKVGLNSDADIVVINTCSVTQVADKKCRQAIKKVTGNGAKIVVIGCYSQLKPEELSAIQGVDLVLGTKEKFNVVEHVERLFYGKLSESVTGDAGEIRDYDAAYSTNDRTRAFLKVQDGCDYFCSYCTVPLARGRSRNESIEEVVKHVRSISEKGIEEIILTGVNIGDFGKSTNQNFLQLIRELDKSPLIKRFRISSIEPNLLSDEIISFVTNSNNFVHHFHIPLQSGSNQILSLMNRRYTRELFASRVNSIRSEMPFACIGSDIIVGFPGETEDEFENTYNYIKSLDINYLHVFPYSPRPNTRAVNLKDQVKSIDKTKRSRQLLDLSEVKKAKFYEINTGRTESVIFESKKKDEMISGFTSNYIKVETEYNKDLIGRVLKIKLKKINDRGNFEIEILK